MPRAINATQPYRDKLLKLIPTEIVAAYMVLAGILGFGATAAAPSVQQPSRLTDAELQPILIQVVFFVLLVLTPVYLRKVSRVTGVAQLGVTTLSFAVWVYTLGGPFIVWDIYYPLIASVILVLWSLITPLFVSPAPE